MTSSAATIAQAAGVAGLMTAAQHLIFRDNDALRPEERYAMGTVTIVGAFALWALRHGRGDALGALVVISAAAGLAPIAGYRSRRAHDQAAINEALARRGR